MKQAKSLYSGKGKTYTVIITGESGSGKSTLVNHLETKLSNCVIIRVDDVKFNATGKVFKDKPLLKYQWQDHQSLGENGRGDTMAFLNDEHAYEVVMQYADPIIEEDLRQQIKQARSDVKDYIILEYCEMEGIPNLWDQANLRVWVWSLGDSNGIPRREKDVSIIAARHGKIQSRHGFRYNDRPNVDKLYTQRDKTLSFRKESLRKYKYDLTICNDYQKPDRMKKMAECFANYLNDQGIRDLLEHINVTEKMPECEHKAYWLYRLKQPLNCELYFKHFGCGKEDKCSR